MQTFLLMLFALITGGAVGYIYGNTHPLKVHVQVRDKNHYLPDHAINRFKNAVPPPPPDIHNSESNLNGNN